MPRSPAAGRPALGDGAKVGKSALLALSGVVCDSSTSVRSWLHMWDKHCQDIARPPPLGCRVGSTAGKVALGRARAAAGGAHCARRS